jgi:hypothetical protein
MLQHGCCALAIAALPAGCAYKTTEIRESDPGMTVTTYSPGYIARTLPSGYQTRVVRGTTYYTYGGTYFRPHSSGYVVVDAP